MYDFLLENFDIQAVFKPASDKPTAALSPEPPAPRTTTSYSWSIILYLLIYKLKIPNIVNKGIVIANIFKILFATFLILSLCI